MPKFSGCLMAALLASALAMPTNAGAEPPKTDGGRGAGACRSGRACRASCRGAALRSARRRWRAAFNAAARWHAAFHSPRPRTTFYRSSRRHAAFHHASTCAALHAPRRTPHVTQQTAVNRSLHIVAAQPSNRFGHPWLLVRAAARPHPPRARAAQCSRVSWLLPMQSRRSRTWRRCPMPAAIATSAAMARPASARRPRGKAASPRAFRRAHNRTRTGVLTTSRRTGPGVTIIAPASSPGTGRCSGPTPIPIFSTTRSGPTAMTMATGTMPMTNSSMACSGANTVRRKTMPTPTRRLPGIVRPA